MKTVQLDHPSTATKFGRYMRAGVLPISGEAMRAVLPGSAAAKVIDGLRAAASCAPHFLDNARDNRKHCHSADAVLELEAQACARLTERMREPLGVARRWLESVGTRARDLADRMRQYEASLSPVDLKRVERRAAALEKLDVRERLAAVDAASKRGDKVELVAAALVGVGSARTLLVRGLDPDKAAEVEADAELVPAIECMCITAEIGCTELSNFVTVGGVPASDIAGASGRDLLAGYFGV